MSRFSPQVAVQDRSGEILADAIARGIEGFAAARRARRAEAQHTKDRTRAQESEDLSLALNGIHRGAAPTEAATPVGGGFMAVTPTQDVTQRARPAFDFSRMQPVTQAPKRFEQVTPNFYRDNKSVEEQARAARQLAFATAIARSLGESAGARRRSVGTLNILGPDGKPVVANRFDDGAIEPTSFAPYDKPTASSQAPRVYDPSRGVLVDREKGEVVPLRGLPAREFAPRTLGGSRRDPNIITLERQIQETQRGLAPVEKELHTLDGAADQPRLGARRATLQQRQRTLSHRLDSLTTVRDRRAAEQMGVAPDAPDAAAPEAAADTRAALEREFAKNAALYQQLLATPSVSAEEARRAYDESNTMVARKYGARSDR